MAANIRYIHINRDYRKFGTLSIVPFSLGLNFLKNIAKFPTPKHTDVEVATETNTLLGIHDGRQIVTGKTVTASEKVQLKIVIGMIDDNAEYAEPIANTLASQGGDENIAISLLSALGFSWYIREGHVRGDGFIDYGVDWVHVHEGNIVETREIHHFQYGKPTVMNIAPTDPEEVSLPVGDIIFSGLKSGDMIAYRHASTTTVSKKSGTTTPTTPVTPSLGKVITPIPINKAKHPVIDINNPIQLAWGPGNFSGHNKPNFRIKIYDLRIKISFLII